MLRQTNNITRKTKVNDSRNLVLINEHQPETWLSVPLREFGRKLVSQISVISVFRATCLYSVLNHLPSLIRAGMKLNIMPGSELSTQQVWIMLLISTSCSRHSDLFSADERFIADHWSLHYVHTYVHIHSTANPLAVRVISYTSPHSLAPPCSRLYEMSSLIFQCYFVFCRPGPCSSCSSCLCQWKVKVFVWSSRRFVSVCLLEKLQVEEWCLSKHHLLLRHVSAHKHQAWSNTVDCSVCLLLWISSLLLTDTLLFRKVLM